MCTRPENKIMMMILIVLAKNGKKTYLVPFLSQNLQVTSVTWWDCCPITIFKTCYQKYTACCINSLKQCCKQLGP